MQQHHKLDISVLGTGEIKVEVHYRDRVPNLLAQFSQEVQRRALRLFWLKSPYERKLWKAARNMPFWVRQTIRQHILHERATRIDERLQKAAAKRAEKERRREVMWAERQSVRELSAPSLEQPMQEQPREVQASDLRPIEPVRDAATRGDTAVVVFRAPPPERVGLDHRRLSAGLALSSVGQPRLTLTEQLARQHGTAPAMPRDARNVLAQGRGR